MACTASLAGRGKDGAPCHIGRGAALTQRHRDAAQGLTDASEADEAEVLAGKLMSHTLVLEPLALAHGAVGHGDHASLGEQVREGKLDHRVCSREGGVDHHNPNLRGHLEVDVIHADASACHEPGERGA